MKFTQKLFIVGVASLPCSTALAQDISRVDDGAVVERVAPPEIGALAAGPVGSIQGVLGSGSADWPSISGTQTGRLNRNGVASSCAQPKACDIFNTDPGRAFDAYTIPNSGTATACVDVTLDVITQTDCNLQVDAYLNSFDPNSICADYLADPGLSSGVPPSPINFSTNVPAGQNLVLVVHTVNPGEIGCEYNLVLAGDSIGETVDIPVLSRVGLAILVLLIATSSILVIRLRAT